MGNESMNLGRLEQKDFDKYDALVLYIAKRNEGNTEFGSTILNKVIVDAEFQAYFHLGKAITGSPAQHEPNGPISTPLLKCIRNLESRNLAKVARTRYYTQEQDRLVVAPGAEADMSLFTTEEIRIIDAAIEFWWGKTAEEASEIAHEKFVGWQLTEEHEKIPYESVFLESRPLTEQEIEFARGLQRRTNPLSHN